MAHNESINTTNGLDTHGARLRIPRSRGAVSGLLLVLLGAWGALAPLIGPYVHFGFTPDTAWHLSSGRIWLEILPGAVAVLGGFVLLTAANRVTTSLGAWLGVAAGAWFVINTPLGTLFNLGSVGTPIATSKAGKAVQFLLLFDGLGAVIIFIAAAALGRLAVISVRDVEAARRREDNDRNDEPVYRTVQETPSAQAPVVDEPIVHTRARVVEPPTRTTLINPDFAVATDRDDLSPRGGATSLNNDR